VRAATAQRVTRRRFRRRRFAVGRLVTALAFGVRERERRGPFEHRREKLLHLRAGAETRDEAAREDHRRDVGLRHETAPELLEDERRVDEAAAVAALVFREGNGEPAVVSHRLPDLRLPADFGRAHLAKARDGRILVDELFHGVDDHLLFFGELEIHRSGPVWKSWMAAHGGGFAGSEPSAREQAVGIRPTEAPGSSSR
jgi:hypothetical protein